MNEMIHYVTIGTVLGLSAGLAPGPLLTLVISETIMHDIRAGIKVALAPLVTDLPIIVLTVFILSRLSGFHDILGVISLVGGLLVLVMGIQGIKTKGVDIDIQKTGSRSLAKGILVNILSPHPYLFWLSVGGTNNDQGKRSACFCSCGVCDKLLFFAGGIKSFIGCPGGKIQNFFKGSCLYLHHEIFRACPVRSCCFPF